MKGACVAHWIDIGWNRRVEYWAFCSSVRSFARTAHYFTCSALLASLARSSARIRTWERSLFLWNDCVSFIHYQSIVQWLFKASSLAPHCLLRSRARSLTFSRAHGNEVFVYEMNVSISNHFNPQCYDGCAYLLAHSWDQFARLLLSSCNQAKDGVVGCWKSSENLICFNICLAKTVQSSAPPIIWLEL